MFVAGSKTPQIANDDGTLNLNGHGVRDDLSPLYVPHRQGPDADRPAARAGAVDHTEI